MAITVGANLTAVRSKINSALAHGLRALLIHMSQYYSKTVYNSDLTPKLFTKAGAPVTNTSADSPGSDLCFVIDTTNSDLYFIHSWSAAGTFTSVKIID